MSKDKEIEELLNSSIIEDIITRRELEKQLKSGKKLRIKYGVDVTRPDIHLGHAVCLRFLKKFQDLGHTVIFLIGDATTRIGDPTGTDKTRPLLSDEEINRNAKTYIDQVGCILDTKKIEIRKNSEWFDKMSMFDLQNLMTKVTHSQLISREAFQKRIKEGKEIAAHELTYPIMQGYDSVILKADIAVHSDQLFNEHFGRMLQEKFNQNPQVIMTLKMLVGLDGKKKMSKSLDNYIGLTEPADQMFGKTMSIPDDVIVQYFELCTDKDSKEIAKQLKAGENPRNLKFELAKEIVAIYHGAKEAQKAAQEFEKIFKNKEKPTEMPKFKYKKGEKLVDILAESKIVSSKTDARNLIRQKGVKDNDKTVSDIDITLDSGKHIIQVGKRRFIELSDK